MLQDIVEKITTPVRVESAENEGAYLKITPAKGHTFSKGEGYFLEFENEVESPYLFLRTKDFCKFAVCVAVGRRIEINTLWREKDRKPSAVNVRPYEVLLEYVGENPFGYAEGRVAKNLGAPALLHRNPDYLKKIIEERENQKRENEERGEK